MGIKKMSNTDSNDKFPHDPAQGIDSIDDNDVYWLEECSICYSSLHYRFLNYLGSDIVLCDDCVRRV